MALLRVKVKYPTCEIDEQYCTVSYSPPARASIVLHTEGLTSK